MWIKAGKKQRAAEDMLKMLAIVVFGLFALAHGQQRPMGSILRQHANQCEPCNIEACRTPSSYECLSGKFIFK